MRSKYVPPAKVAAVVQKLTPTNQLICQMMAATGLRIGDVVKLRRSDLLHAIQNRGWMPVTEEKTGKRRSVRMPVSLARQALYNAGKVWAFPNKCDARKHRTRGATWEQLNRVQPKRSAQRVTPHTFRKMYAVGKYRKTGSLRKVQLALNHDRPETTAIYAFSDVMEAAAQTARKQHRRTRSNGR